MENVTSKPVSSQFDPFSMLKIALTDSNFTSKYFVLSNILKGFAKGFFNI